MRNIRDNIATNKIPGIILTASSEKIVKDEAFKIGVEGYMCKPFEPEELLGIIDREISKGDKDESRPY